MILFTFHCVRRQVAVTSDAFMSVNPGYADVARVSDLEFRLEWLFHYTFCVGGRFFPSSEYNGLQHRNTTRTRTRERFKTTTIFRCRHWSRTRTSQKTRVTNNGSFVFYSETCISDKVVSLNCDNQRENTHKHWLLKQLTCTHKHWLLKQHIRGLFQKEDFVSLLTLRKVKLRVRHL